MSRPTVAIVVFSLLLPVASRAAETRVAIGTFIGQQSYRSYLDDPRVLSGLELLVLRAPLGLHVAGEYADVDEHGALLVEHVDVVYQHALPQHFSLMLGGGPTFVNTGKVTWNLEGELARRFGRVDVFARVRQFDFELQSERGGESGPNGPAIYVGLRLALR